MKRVHRRIAIAMALIGAFVAAPSPAGAKERVDTRVETHCIVELNDSSTADSTKSSRQCFSSEAAVDKHLDANSQRSSSNVIGRHYSSTSYSGSTITITGTTCSGGVWYATGSWNNNIESTRNYCGSAGTRFYNSSNCAGSNRFVTSQQSTLGWMNNLTSCVRYG